ncbi:matrixin family metalloprotease [Streptosporangium lutulentum]
MLPKSTLKKGDKGPEVQFLFQYLKRFGYFPNESLSAGNTLFRPAVPFAPEDTSVYDDRMELAVTAFQERQGLEPTGIVDDQTIALIQRPRCGVPDYPVTGGDPTLAQGEADPFVVWGTRWPTRNVTYSFSNTTSDLSVADQRAAVEAAFARWAAVTPLTFTEIAAEGDIRIGWYTGEHGDGKAFDGPGGSLVNVLAHCFYPPPNGGPIAGDCHFDDAETWSVNLPPSGIDLHTVALHEFGHGLGLDHSSVPSSVMYASHEGPRRELTDDDVYGIQSIYGRRFPWASLGGTVFQPAVGRNQDGRLEVFVRGNDARLYHIWQVAPGGVWSGWTSLGGAIQGRIAVGRNRDGRLEVFARGARGSAAHLADVGRRCLVGLGLARRDDRGPGRGDQRRRAAGGVRPRERREAVSHLADVGRGVWSGWTSLGGAIQGRVTVGRNRDGRLELFARGTGGDLCHIWQTWAGGIWSGWASLGGAIEDPTVAINADGRLELFARGARGSAPHLADVG